MSKLKKLFKTPKLFFHDFALKKGLSKKRSIQECFKEITDFAQYYDVNSMKIESEYIWPYIRNHMWVNLNYVSIGKNYRRSLNSIGLQNGHPSQISLAFRDYVKYKYNAQEIGDIQTQKVDFLFFTQIGGTEQITIDSKIYYRITDPIYEIAKTIGSAEKIEIIKSQNANKIKKWPNYFHQSKLILPPLIQTYGYAKKMTMNATFFHRWKQYVPSLLLSNKRQLNAIVDYEFHTRSFYLDLLQKMQPKVILLHGFHYHAPLISAANKLGIVTVDLQHGLQVGWNPLYNNYDELPSSGYQTLPDFFAVWGLKEYKNILKTFKSTKHRPIYMGNPWLDKLENLISEDLPKSLLHKISQYETKVLIIMQNQTKIPTLFLELIDQSPKDILWIVRHHPKGEKFTKTDFSIKDNVLLSPIIDNILINILFKYINISISEGSALATEADYFGVHNIIISKEGYDNYQEEIENEKFYFLQKASEFQDILDKITKNKNLIPIKSIQKTNIKEFLFTLYKTIKVCTVATSVEYIHPHEEQISELSEHMWMKIKNSSLSEAISIFFEIRKKLLKTPNIDNIYQAETSLWEKEAKIFKRHIQKLQSKNNNEIILIGDSLHLPRPSSSTKLEYGIKSTTSYIFNNIPNNPLQLSPWAQRYLTSEKILNNWSRIMENIEEKHLIIHIGVNDSAERIFLEKQRLALNAYSNKTKDSIINFAKKYKNSIMQNQTNHTYVSYDNFTKNIRQITQMAIDSRVKSLTFINIISLPYSYEKSSIYTQRNTERYNNVLIKLPKQFPDFNIRIIDLDKMIHQDFTKYMDTDMIHLNKHGHIYLANEISKNILEIL